MSAHPIAASNFPYPSLVHGMTKNEVKVHEMKNFIPSIKFEKVEVVIRYFEGEYTHLCWGCGEPLVKGTIIGEGFYHSTQLFHLDEIEVDGQIIRREIKVKVKRKSHRHPEGFRRIEFIGTLAGMMEYLQTVSLAGYHVIGVL